VTDGNGAAVFVGQGNGLADLGQYLGRLLLIIQKYIPLGGLDSHVLSQGVANAVDGGEAVDEEEIFCLDVIQENPHGDRIFRKFRTHMVIDANDAVGRIQILVNRVDDLGL